MLIFTHDNKGNVIGPAGEIVYSNEAVMEWPGSPRYAADLLTAIQPSGKIAHWTLADLENYYETFRGQAARKPGVFVRINDPGAAFGVRGVVYLTALNNNILIARKQGAMWQLAGRRWDSDPVWRFFDKLTDATNALNAYKRSFEQWTRSQ